MATGAATVIGTTGAQIPDITIGSDGVLRGWSEWDGTTSDDPIVINKSTGGATTTPSGLGTAQTGVAILDADHLFVKSGSIYSSVNVNTGAATFLFSSVSTDNLLENWNGGLLTGDRFGGSGGGTQWYGIDSGTGASTTLGFTSGIQFSAVTVVTNVVPEPASFAIFGTIGLLACGRRRKR